MKIPVQIVGVYQDSDGCAVRIENSLKYPTGVKETFTLPITIEDFSKLKLGKATLTLEVE